MQSLLLPNKVFRFTSQHSGNHMNCLYKDKLYNMGFLFLEPMRFIRPHICETSKVFVLDEPTEDNMCMISIEKKININKLPCHVTEMGMDRFSTLPFTSNIGIAFAYDIIDEDLDAYFFECQIFDASTFYDLFKQKLNSDLNFEIDIDPDLDFGITDL